MVEEVVAQAIDGGENPRKRRMGQKKGGKTKKKLKVIPVGAENNVKIDRKMKKLIRKRVRDYNSDDDEENEENLPLEVEGDMENTDDENSSDEEDGIEQGKIGKEEASDDEDGEVQPGITKLTEGCKAFRLAFKKIMKKNVSDNLLGPVLSAHKKLVAEKLAEEDLELKAKGAIKKEKHLVGEKGHVKPANFLDTHDKFLIGVATKGVVKLFNAVNKAQHAQKGLDPSRSKDAKVIRKRRKEAFFSELGKKSSGTLKTQSAGSTEGEGPAWAPLRDNYMLTNSKLKNWNKMPNTNVTEDIGRMGSDSSSDDEE